MYYKNKIYTSVGKEIVILGKEGDKKEKYLKINQLGFINYCSLYNRALRHGIHNFYKIDDDIDCVVIKGKILFYRNRKLINILQIEKGSRPLRNGIVYKDNYIIYSEYHGNESREPVNIYKYNFIKNKKEILYTFDNIRHIHFIQQDINYSNNIYIGTGDLDGECGIYKFDFKGAVMKKIGGGSQIWRAVSLIQNNQTLYWGTDDPDGQNYIMRYNLEEGKLEKVQEIDGPAYYAVKTKSNDMFIATTIEDRDRHKAIIYKKVDEEKWNEYKEFKKDLFHTKYFGYGLVEFINNQGKLDELIYNLNGLREKSNKGLKE